jgi:hypothetical protein
VVLHQHAGSCRLRTMSDPRPTVELGNQAHRTSRVITARAPVQIISGHGLSQRHSTRRRESRQRGLGIAYQRSQSMDDDYSVDTLLVTSPTCACRSPHTGARNTCRAAAMAIPKAPVIARVRVSRWCRRALDPTESYPCFLDGEPTLTHGPRTDRRGSSSGLLHPTPATDWAPPRFHR